MISDLPGGTVILEMLLLINFMEITFHRAAGSHVLCALTFVRGAERTCTGAKTGKHMGSNGGRFRAVVCFPDSETFIVFSRFCRRSAASCGLLLLAGFLSLAK
jgi:hypothetical protein